MLLYPQDWNIVTHVLCRVSNIKNYSELSNTKQSLGWENLMAKCLTKLVQIANFI